MGLSPRIFTDTFWRLLRDPRKFGDQLAEVGPERVLWPAVGFFVWALLPGLVILGLERRYGLRALVLQRFG